ncbi:MAG: DUF554 domain-containing protein [Acutalibacteraceae bacterium]
MIGLGTIVNVAAVLLGGGLGLLLRGGLKERFQTILMQALGLVTVVIGISATMKEMLTVTDGALGVQGTMLLIVSLVIGSFVGEAFKIEQRMEHAGEWLKGKLGIRDDARFTDAFVSTTLIVCVGAMAIVGALQDGLTGDASTLYAKAVLDGVLLVIMASTLGIGALFSALPLGLYQGLITLCAAFAAPFMSDRLIGNLSLVGSVLIMTVGINLMFGKRLSPGNMLPSLLGPVVAEVIFCLCGM